MSEKTFENQVKRYLAANRIWYVKIWGGGFQKAGIPDILACVNGIFFGIELKSETGRPSELQKMNIRKINESGGIGVILYPDGFGEFKTMIGEVKKCSGHTAALTALKDVHTTSGCDIWTGSS